MHSGYEFLRQHPLDLQSVGLVTFVSTQVGVDTSMRRSLVGWAAEWAAFQHCMAECGLLLLPSTTPLSDLGAPLLHKTLGRHRVSGKHAISPHNHSRLVHRKICHRAIMHNEEQQRPPNSLICVLKWIVQSCLQSSPTPPPNAKPHV